MELTLLSRELVLFPKDLAPPGLHASESDPQGTDPALKEMDPPPQGTDPTRVPYRLQ